MTTSPVRSRSVRSRLARLAASAGLVLVVAGVAAPVGHAGSGAETGSVGGMALSEGGLDLSSANLLLTEQTTNEVVTCRFTNLRDQGFGTVSANLSCPPVPFGTYTGSWSPQGSGFKNSVECGTAETATFALDSSDPAIDCNVSSIADFAAEPPSDDDATPPVGDDDTTGREDLPRTGTDSTTWMVVVATLLIGAGMSLLGQRRPT